MSKKGEIKRLKDEMENTNKIVDGMKDECNKKVRENETKINQAKKTAAEAEACDEIVKKEERGKVTERKQHKNEINEMKINCNQALTQPKNKINEILMLKKDNGKSKATDEARSEEKSMKLGSSEKMKGGRIQIHQKPTKNWTNG